jgi:D-sedoheptulose 7-phosphate isomerase
MRFKHAILDRDGVLNQEAPDRGYVREPEAFHWLPTALEGLVILSRAGVRISIATNQSGVGRGLMTLEQLHAVHERMRRDAKQAGVDLENVFFCPHAPDAGCDCRKPATGLIKAAIARSGIHPDDTVVVGDDLRDLEAAQRSGVAAVLLRTGKGRSNEARVRDLGVPIYNDLPAFARAILADTLSTETQDNMTIHQVFAEHASVMTQAAAELPPVLERIVALFDQCMRGGHKILACGNGGSACDSQHLVAELVGRFRDERRALPAVALTADTAILTAVGNDYGYERVFARQVEALGQQGDLLLAISTSGNSPNVVQAARTARGLGCVVVAFTGAQGGKLTEHADVVLRAPSTVVARIQEVHALSIHIIADALDALLRRATVE